MSQSEVRLSGDFSYFKFHIKFEKPRTIEQAKKKILVNVSCATVCAHVMQQRFSFKPDLSSFKTYCLSI